MHIHRIALQPTREQTRRAQRRDQTRRRLGQHPSGQHGRGTVLLLGLSHLAGRRPQHPGSRGGRARRHRRHGPRRVHRQPDHRTRRFQGCVRSHRNPRSDHAVGQVGGSPKSVHIERLVADRRGRDSVHVGRQLDLNAHTDHIHLHFHRYASDAAKNSCYAEVLSFSHNHMKVYLSNFFFMQIGAIAHLFTQRRLQSKILCPKFTVVNTYLTFSNRIRHDHIIYEQVFRLTRTLYYIVFNYLHLEQLPTKLNYYNDIIAQLKSENTFHISVSIYGAGDSIGVKSSSVSL